MYHTIFLLLGDLIIVLLQGFFFGVGIRASAGVFNVIMLSLIPVLCWLLLTKPLKLYKNIPDPFQPDQKHGFFKTIFAVIRAQSPIRLLLALLIESVLSVLWQGFWWQFVLKAEHWYSFRLIMMYVSYGLGILLFWRMLWSFLAFYQIMAQRSRALRVIRAIVISVVILFQIPPLVLTIKYHDQKYTLEEADSIPYKDMIVLGAGVFANGRISVVLQDRVDTAADLYKAGDFHRIMLSGDNSDRAHNEVDAMFSIMQDNGIPTSALLRDDDGFGTYESCQNAREQFGIDQAVLITQNFHTTRSLYVCESIGVKAVSVSADRSVYNISSWIGWHVNDWVKLSLSWFANLLFPITS